MTAAEETTLGAEGATASGNSQAKGPQHDETLESRLVSSLTDGVRGASLQSLRFRDRGGRSYQALSVYTRCLVQSNENSERLQIG